MAWNIMTKILGNLARSYMKYWAKIISGFAWNIMTRTSAILQNQTWNIEPGIWHEIWQGPWAILQDQWSKIVQGHSKKCHDKDPGKYCKTIICETVIQDFLGGVLTQTIMTRILVILQDHNIWKYWPMIPMIIQICHNKNLGWSHKILPDILT